MPVPIIEPAPRSHLHPLLVGLALLGTAGGLVALALPLSSLHLPQHAALVWSPILAVTPASAWLGPATLMLLRPWPFVIGCAVVAAGAVVILGWRRRRARWGQERFGTPRC